MSDFKIKGSLIVEGAGLTVAGSQVSTPASTETLTNKTINADNNTISNLADANIKVGAAIDAAKIANGSVSNAKFQYLGGVTSDIQAQLDAKVDENAPIVGATKTKITYDSKGLVTAGADATTSDIAEGTNLYFTDARAKTAAVVNSTAGNETDRAASVSAMKSYVTGITANLPQASAGDIDETSFSMVNNQSLSADVTGLAFANATVRSFKALVSVEVDATADLFEAFELIGVQKGAGWDMAVTATGDNSQVVFTITSAGQIQYVSANYLGFVGAKIKFRAVTTSK